MKMIPLVFLFTASLFTDLFAQDMALVDFEKNATEIASIPASSKAVFVPKKAVLPIFKGGNVALAEFLDTHLEYPVMAHQYQIEGTVIVEFIVDVDGSVQQSKVIKKMGYGLDEAALKTVQMMPKWEAGRQGELATPVKVKLPIEFFLL